MVKFTVNFRKGVRKYCHVYGSWHGWYLYLGWLALRLSPRSCKSCSASGVWGFCPSRDVKEQMIAVGVYRG